MSKIIGNTVGTPMNPQKFADAGESAYDIAVRHGFEGTEAEWIASLKGVGIKSIEFTDGFNLKITTTDDITVISDSLQGVPGAAGVGITEIYYNELSGKLYIKLSNGTSLTTPDIRGGKGNDGYSPTVAVSKSGKVTTVAITDKDGTKTATINDGTDGDRGFSVLRVTTALSSYTTAVGGFTPKYRIALSTVLSESGASEVRVGDTILRNYYTYHVGYVDSSYVYVGAYASIRGSSVSVSSVTESDESGGENVVTFSDNKTLTVKNGTDGKSAYQYAKDGGYTGTEEEFATKLAEEIPAKVAPLSTEEKTLLLTLFSKAAYAEDVSETYNQLKSLWGFGETLKNWILYSTESDGTTIFNGGLGYRTGKRLSSSGTEKDLNTSLVTGFIPCKAGDVLRFAMTNGKTVSRWRDDPGQTSSLVAYNSAKTMLGQFTAQPAGYGIFQYEIEVDKMVKNGDVWEYTVINNADIAFVRVTLPYIAGSISGDDHIITINQEIK